MYGIARLIKLEYMIGFYNDSGKFVEELKEKIIIKPIAINFNEEAQKIHKISYQKAINEGVDSNIVMKQFMKNLRDVHIIVSHNIRFHLKSIQSECFRTFTYIDFRQFILIDTSTF
jgi:DNA polymerase III epsilon subunit-like protein